MRRTWHLSTLEMVVRWFLIIVVNQVEVLNSSLRTSCRIDCWKGWRALSRYGSDLSMLCQHEIPPRAPAGQTGTLPISWRFVGFTILCMSYP